MTEPMIIEQAGFEQYHQDILLLIGYTLNWYNKHTQLVYNWFFFADATIFGINIFEIILKECIYFICADYRTLYQNGLNFPTILLHCT